MNLFIGVILDTHTIVSKREKFMLARFLDFVDIIFISELKCWSFIDYLETIKRIICIQLKKLFWETLVWLILFNNKHYYLLWRSYKKQSHNIFAIMVVFILCWLLAYKMCSYCFNRKKISKKNAFVITIFST